MKRVCFFAAATLLGIWAAIGCSGKPTAVHPITSPFNQVRLAGGGDEILRREIPNEDKKIVKLVSVKVTSIHGASIAIQCQEFTKPTSGRNPGGEGWRLNEEFERRYEYKGAPLSVKVKDYEFEILKLENGRISYMRVM